MNLGTSIRKGLKARFPLVEAVLELRHRLKAGEMPIYLEYPIDPRPRYGWGNPEHSLLNDLIAERKNGYFALIRQLALHEEQLSRIARAAPGDPFAPFWMNRFVTGLDAAALYAFPRLFKSRLYVEVGSGNSTKFVRRSVVDNHLETRIISIDPHPRVEVDELCDQVIRQPLETVDLEVFDQLERNDILMVDSSHRCFQNSDVAVTFLEVLPRLRPGVLIYIDDIYLPYDYPQEWVRRHYSEQYLLAVMLLADRGLRYEILFPSFFISGIDKELQRAVADFWHRCGLQSFANSSANGFWMRVRS
jgi:hypothetical protein